MTREQAKQIVYDSVFNGEYAATEAQTRAFYTIFKDEVNHPEVLHKISHDELLRFGWDVRWKGVSFEQRYHTTYQKMIDGRHISIDVDNWTDAWTLMTSSMVNYSGVHATVKYLEDIDMLLEYDGIDYRFVK